MTVVTTITIATFIVGTSERSRTESKVSVTGSLSGSFSSIEKTTSERSSTCATGSISLTIFASSLVCAVDIVDTCGFADSTDDVTDRLTSRFTTIEGSAIRV